MRQLSLLAAALALLAALPLAAQTRGDPALPAAAQATAVVARPQRLALVVGNAAYREAPLANPVNDAQAMAAVLRDAGFAVLLHTNVDQRSLQAAVRDFGNRLRQGGGTGLFYFAGHGMQIKGRNYLIPVGADIQREDEVAYAALDAQAVLDKMETAGNGTNLMILDACRNNPFARSFRSASQGLAPMEAPVGTLVAYATAPGAVASDGNTTNGLYTQHLLSAMRRPGAKVEDVFKQVRSAVRRDSQGRQIPWEATSLEGDLYFFEPPAAAAAAPAASAPPLAAPAPTAARPAATTPRANAQGFTVGDRWNFQVIDRYRGEVVRNYGRRVAHLEPDGGWLDGAGARYDAHGRIQRWATASGEKHVVTPHAPRWWPGMQVGDMRRFSYEEAVTPARGSAYRNQVDAEGRVVVRETVRVPAGEFSALRVEIRARVSALGRAGAGTFTSTFWYVPELRSWVARDLESTWNGRPGEREREELTSFALVNTPRGN